MKITRVNIPRSFNNNGIDDIRMSRLGHVVLVSGRNGSGKSRLLANIAAALSQKPTFNSIQQWRSKIVSLEKQIAKLKSTIVACKGEMSQSESENVINQLVEKAETQSEEIKAFEKRIDNLNTQINWTYLETSPQNFDSVVNVCYFVPTGLKLSDSSQFSSSQLKSVADNVGVNVTANLSEGAFAKIQHIQNRWFNATHPKYVVEKSEKDTAISDYARLNELIKIFLGTSIERDLDGSATLFGFPLAQTNLSEGQRVLLQFCVAIYSQQTALSNLILFMDEPENHLHPSIIIETIERISACAKNGQIWISTHSIPVISHFAHSTETSLYYMEEGRIAHAGDIPERVLAGLLGDDEEIAKLQDFIGLPAQHALNRFAYECLFEPSAITTGKDDPQMLQVRNELGHLQKVGKIKILDYGAGKGRIIANILESLGGNPKSFTDNHEYIAFDRFDSDKDECKRSIESAYGSSENYYFNDTSALLGKHDRGSFDIVIMCNVLHEIDPKDWLNLFKTDGEITSLLSDEGRLVIVEDNQIPSGEKAYQNGFVVLDTPHLKELFAMSQNEFTYQDERNGRLKCHAIPKPCLLRITPDTRIVALKSIMTTARQNIVALRNGEKNYKNGKLHAFWVQQFANASLALAELTTDN